MPTIEIVSINCTGLNLEQEDFEIAIIKEDKLESHRGLFYDFLKVQTGVIIHLGNANFKFNKGNGFFAGELIDWDSKMEKNLKFKEKYKTEIDKLLMLSIDNSPICKTYFLFDYQFENGIDEVELTTQDFWKIHDTEGLKFNKLYQLTGKY